jgi:hypothetical protein
MDRTTKTFRETMDIECTKWRTFRRQLRPDDRERLDKIFVYVRMHADSETVVSISHRIDVVFRDYGLEMGKQKAVCRGWKAFHI